MSRKSQSASPLWPLIYGLGIVAFNFFLLVLRAGIIPFLVFMTAGIAMIVFWTYFSIRTKPNSIAKQSCECAICSHKTANFCLEKECACCIVVKEGSIVGHTNSPLQ
jgi:hypothetical protein